MENAGVKSEFEGRTLANALSQRLISRLLVAQVVVDLTEEEVEAGLLVTATGLSGSALQVGQGFGKAFLTEQEVGLGGIGGTLYAGTRRVTTHLGEGFFGIIVPVDLGIATRLPLTCLGSYCGFGSIEAGDVGEG